MEVLALAVACADDSTLGRLPGWEDCNSVAPAMEAVAHPELVSGPDGIFEAMIGIAVMIVEVAADKVCVEFRGEA